MPFDLAAMYGLVNRAIHQMVATHHGEHAWDSSKERADLQDLDVFSTYKAYPDDVTGLLHGLEKRFRTPVADDRIASRGQGDARDLFQMCLALPPDPVVLHVDRRRP